MSQSSSAVTQVYAPSYGPATPIPTPPGSNSGGNPTRINAGVLTLVAVAVVGIGAGIFFTLKRKK